MAILGMFPGRGSGPTRDTMRMKKRGPQQATVAPWQCVFRGRAHLRENRRALGPVLPTLSLTWTEAAAATVMSSRNPAQALPWTPLGGAPVAALRAVPEHRRGRWHLMLLRAAREAEGVRPQQARTRWIVQAPEQGALALTGTAVRRAAWSGLRPVQMRASWALVGSSRRGAVLPLTTRCVWTRIATHQASPPCPPMVARPTSPRRGGVNGWASTLMLLVTLGQHPSFPLLQLSRAGKALVWGRCHCGSA
mmetsp:Transcript_51819/g.137020  ORF Transcript_51819/g.137020 Transcript_51819/m.137020 type:complete len:250 (+) Transcript_51819:564-1313(+)